jgi:hypothetical protein
VGGNEQGKKMKVKSGEWKVESEKYRLKEES